MGQITDAQYQEVVINALQTIQHYGSACNKHKSKVTQLDDFFKSMDVKVVNDIPVFNSYDTRITAEEYSQKLRSQIETLSVTINVVDVLEVLSTSPSTGTIKLLITKEVEGKGVSEKYQVDVKDGIEKWKEGIKFKDEFREYIVIEYSFNTNNSSTGTTGSSSYKISDISLEKKKGTLVVMSPVVKKRNKFFTVEDIQFTYELNDKEFKHKGAMFKSLIDLNEGWSLEVTDVTYAKDFVLLRKTYDSEHITEYGSSYLLPITFKLPIGSIQAYTTFNIDPIKVESGQDALTLNNSISNSFFGELAINLPKKNDNNRAENFYLKKWRGIVGVGYESYNYKIGQQNNSYNFNSIDIDGYSYNRLINVSSFEENHKINLVNGFVGVEPMFSVFKMDVLLSARMGRVFFVDGTYTNYANSIEYSGYYEDLFGVTIVDSYDDFGGVSNVGGSGDLNFNSDIYFWRLQILAQIKIGEKTSIMFGPAYTNYYQGSLFEYTPELLNERFEDDGIANDMNSIINSPVNLSFKYPSIVFGLSFKI